MSDEYVPTTEDVRLGYQDQWATAAARAEAAGQFDAWLAAHDAEQVRELQAENESLRTALRRKENHRARAREQVRQRDEVIERVRKLADEWERTYPSLMVGPFLRAVLEGDGEVKEENDE